MSIDVTFTAADSGEPKQGCPDNYGITFLNGVTSCHVSLSKSGVEETAYPRVLVDTSYPWAMLIPQSHGTGVYEVKAYTASSGGSVIGTSEAFSVAQSTLPSFPLSGDSTMMILGDSTVAQGYLFNFSPLAASGVVLDRWLGIAMRLLGYPADASLWTNHHDGTGSEGATKSGGYVDGVTGDRTLSNGSGGGPSDIPGYVTRIYRVLAQRPKLLIIQVTVNDLSAIAPATSIANYQAMANQATLAGSAVLFVMMRPLSDGATSTALNNRVTINQGVASICGATAGCYFFDPSPAYTKVGGGASAYDSAVAIQELSDIVSGHPTVRGAWLEADLFVTRAGTLGLFGTNNYCLTVFNNAAGEINLTVDPIFNTGTNPSVLLNGGASGTYAAGIWYANGSGAGEIAPVGSIHANPDTGGNLQRLTFTPAGTGLQSNTIGVHNIDVAGYVGYVEVMLEVDITDPEAMVNVARLETNVRVDFATNCYRYLDGQSTTSSAASSSPPAPAGVKKLWYYALAYCDGRQSTLGYILSFTFNATGKTSNVVVDWRRHFCRKLQLSDHREERYMPKPPTIRRAGAASAGTVPMLATLPTDGVKPQGVRWFHRPTSAVNSGWTYGGDVIVSPDDSTAAVTASGLADGTTYDFRVHSLRNGGVIGGGYGRFHMEGTSSTMLTATAATASSRAISQMLLGS